MEETDPPSCDLPTSACHSQDLPDRLPHPSCTHHSTHIEDHCVKDSIHVSQVVPCSVKSTGSHLTIHVVRRLNRFLVFLLIGRSFIAPHRSPGSCGTTQPNPSSTRPPPQPGRALCPRPSVPRQSYPSPCNPSKLSTSSSLLLEPTVPSMFSSP